MGGVSNNAPVYLSILKIKESTSDSNLKFSNNITPVSRYFPPTITNQIGEWSLLKIGGVGIFEFWCFKIYRLFVQKKRHSIDECLSTGAFFVIYQEIYLYI